MIALAPSHKNQLGNYTSWLEKNNFTYKILENKDTLEGCSMLILCGGPDVGTAEKRDKRESAWFLDAYGRIPVLGVCRGLQLANILLGGTLHEDLSSDPIKHASNRIEIANEPNSLMESSYHEIIFTNGRRMKVNSRHHQGIKDLAPGLEPVAKCLDDSLWEMVMGKKSLFVQWHPEREEIWNTEAEMIVSDWIKSCYI